MGTIHRADGFRFVIWSNDHEPAHVHAIRAGEVVVIELRTIRVRKVYGMSDRDVVRAVEIVTENRAYMLKRWKEIHRDA